MPGQTQYMDTPVVPTSAFAGAGYNNPDCAYPDATPAISEVDGDGIGPWVSAAGHTLTITALRSEEHTSELQSQSNLVCRLLLEKKNKHQRIRRSTQRTTVYIIR